MEVEVDLEEQACLAQDVEEAVERKMREESHVPGAGGKMGGSV